MSAATAASIFPGSEDQPHARMVLGAALVSGDPSHAYLFHGPPGAGKRTAARAFAAELLAEGDPDPERIRRRVASGSHPDLTWVQPTGAHVMRVDDVDEPVVAAAGRTPFEARRRVFVLERVDTMNDEVANRMLKTLEEPSRFVHLILLTDALGRVLETVISRCQLVRFDPLSPERIAAGLKREGVPPEQAAESARLALGNAQRARFLASEEGQALRDEVDWLVRHVLGEEEGGPAAKEPWRPLLDRAEHRRQQAEAALAREAESRLELEPKGRERRALERELDDRAKRDGRRARTEVLDQALELAALGFRDLLAGAVEARGAVLASSSALASSGEERGAWDERRLLEAVERCEETRSSLQLNVGEELALTALTFRLAELGRS